MITILKIKFLTNQYYINFEKIKITILNEILTLLKSENSAISLEILPIHFLMFLC